MVRRTWPTAAANDPEPAGGMHALPAPSHLGPAAAGAASSITDEQLPLYNLLVVFDGHNGAHAARFCEAALADTVAALLPPWDSLPPGDLVELAAQVQQALALAFVDMQLGFAAAGRSGGCTATVALQVRPFGG